MSRHGFRATVFCFCSLLVTAFGVVPSYAISKDFNQTVPLQPCGTFELQNVNGPVDVQGWDRNEVEIHAVKTAKQQAADLERVSIEVDARPDAVAVTTRYPQNEGVGGRVKRFKKVSGSSLMLPRNLRSRSLSQDSIQSPGGSSLSGGGVTTSGLDSIN